MAVQQDKSLNSTIAMMVNMGRVREVLNTQMNYNPNVPLTSIQIQGLLRSPLESMIKNMLFFEMVYGAALKAIKRDLLYKLLEKMGMKEQALRYHKWLRKREAEFSNEQIRSGELSELEFYSLKPTPVTYKKEELQHLNDRLDNLSRSLGLVANELAALFLKHQHLVQKLFTLNDAHLKTVQTVARDSGIELVPEQVMTALPEAHAVYHVARTPQEQIRALGRLINEGASANNNIILVKQFMNSIALGTALNSYVISVSSLNAELNSVAEAIIDCQMRHSDLAMEIQQVEAMINHAQNHPAQSQISEPVAVNDLHEMLDNLSSHQSRNSNNIVDEPDQFSRMTTAAPAA